MLTMEAAIVSVPQYSVEYHEVLGRGTFSEVYKVAIPAGARSPTAEDRYFALKRLKRSSRLEDGTAYRASAAADLAMEAKILSSLPCHINIISLHGISEDFFADPGAGFLILDGLKETLSDLMTRWRKGSKSNVKMPLLLPSKSQKSLETAREASRACNICLPVARAMSFLHAHRISYRDIKPSNIGFDANGNVRLFDFGLARVYEPDQGRMTPCTGSARYMSPEVMVGHPYDLSADVYSYSILLWEVCNRKLEKPFATMRSFKAAKRCVVGFRYRPPMHHIYSDVLRQLLRFGWHRDPQLRPSFSAIVSRLEELEATQAGSVYQIAASDYLET